MQKVKKANDTDVERAQDLVALLIKKEDRAFYVLIKACREKAMPHLAKLLENAGISFTDVKLSSKVSKVS